MKLIFKDYRYFFVYKCYIDIKKGIKSDNIL